MPRVVGGGIRASTYVRTYVLCTTGVGPTWTCSNQPRNLISEVTTGNVYIDILISSTYYPPVRAYCEIIFLCSSPLTCQSFSARKIAAQCISSCKFKLSLTYIRTCTYMHHIQHPFTVKCLTHSNMLCILLSLTVQHHDHDTVY